MNAIFFTEGATLRMFFPLIGEVEKSMQLDKIGIHVCDTRFFLSFQKEQPEIISGRYHLLKEWEIVRKSRRHKADISKLREYERELGHPLLWDALVCDRRIYLGRRATLSQDYRSRYSHKRMLSLLQLELERVETFFDEVHPDFLVSFICVTLSGYLGYLVARKRGIPVLNLRPTRINNFIHAGDSITWPSSILQKTYDRYMENEPDPNVGQAAAEFIEQFSLNNVKYEGVTPSTPITKNKSLRSSPGKLKSTVKYILHLFREEWRYRFGYYRDDNWIPGVIWPLWLGAVYSPTRRMLTNHLLRKRFVREEELIQIDYAFFGLHVEPEVTLLVYSKPHMNQIEAIRNISCSLPVGMKLLVKEHPLAKGKRPISYYMKILDIPNVLMLDWNVDSRTVIEKCRLVTSIAGTIGFEGAMLKKPVMTLGACPFNCLPKNMVRNVKAPDELGGEIRDLLDNYCYDETALMCYVAAVMKTSVPVDFYSRLLGRHEFCLEETAESKEETKRQFHALAQYLKEQFKLRISRNSLIEDGIC